MKKLSIDILCSDGSPLGVTLADLWGQGSRGIGIGGSEYSLLTLCEAWANAGHKVRLYNDPVSPVSVFSQYRICEFDHREQRDILIIFRSPNPKAIVANADLKIWWSCDQFTIGDFKTFRPHVDKLVGISEYHSQYFKEHYDIHDMIVIDLPVRYQDFDVIKDVPKIKNRMIYTSVPDRGLQHLWVMWPIIKRDIPDATLVITSDYRLWGCNTPNNGQHVSQWARYDGVEFIGAVPRERLLREQAQAELLLYPSLYDTAELFCVSVAEAQALGVYPITSDWGALKTTNMGTIIPGRADQANFRQNFITEVIKQCTEINMDRINVVRQATQRFHLDNILKQWEEKVFT